MRTSPAVSRRSEPSTSSVGLTTGPTTPVVTPASDSMKSVEAPLAADDANDALPGWSLRRMLAMAPLLLPQARLVSREIQRLGGATGRTGVTTSFNATRARHQDLATGTHVPTDGRVVLLGDSVADGVGIDNHRNTIAGRLACRIAERHNCPVAWTVLASSGADAAETLVQALDPAHEELLRSAQVVVISVGVNDVKNLRTDKAWADDIEQLLTRLTDVTTQAPIFLIGVPPMEIFPAMPRLLGQALGGRARRLDAIAERIVDAYPGVVHIPLVALDLIDPRDPGAFAADGLHPSVPTHRLIARLIDEELRRFETDDEPVAASV